MPPVKMKNFYLIEELLGAQIDHLYTFGRSFVYFRAITTHNIPEAHASKIYFVHIANVNAINSIIEFCNLFHHKTGACSIHWTKIAPLHGNDIKNNKIDNSLFRQTIKTILRDAISASNNEFDDYIKHIVRFRNKFAAHYEINKIPTMPFLDNAFLIANAYLTWLRDEIYWSGEPQKNLMEIKPTFEAEIAAVLPAAPTQQ